MVGFYENGVQGVNNNAVPQYGNSLETLGLTTSSALLWNLQPQAIQPLDVGGGRNIARGGHNGGMLFGDHAGKPLAERRGRSRGCVERFRRQRNPEPRRAQLCISRSVLPAVSVGDGTDDAIPLLAEDSFPINGHRIPARQEKHR